MGREARVPTAPDRLVHPVRITVVENTPIRTVVRTAAEGLAIREDGIPVLLDRTLMASISETDQTSTCHNVVPGNDLAGFWGFTRSEIEDFGGNLRT